VLALNRTSGKALLPDAGKSDFPFILVNESRHRKQATGNSSENEGTPKFLLKV